MFTGIITHQGEIAKIVKADAIYYTIAASKSLVHGLKDGDSIAVDGTCLTVINKSEDSFDVQLMPETIAKTAFERSDIGSLVNLELPLAFAGRLDGHLVQGHVDGVGIVEKYTQQKDNWILGINVPQELRKFIATKGSISINGVSLTISAKTPNGLEVSLIEYTINHTNLKFLKLDSIVNLEVDVIARYVENMI